ncbi:SDR family NAD(P)-dependent oxidoreductase [Cohnella sp. GCM10012308]|uniref:SDR family NAD(P)-dependent oxidoreductase n=1 Tax=Cohnella sp. GCM10012308 TaxID=3317329 RepID=UPI00361E9421
MRNLYIITGTSRGIGLALATRLLALGHTVFGFSRNSCDLLEQYREYNHITIDLANFSYIEEAVDRSLSAAATNTFDAVYLINNAALVEPLRPIDKCTPEEIELNISVGLIAPAIIISAFIRRTMGYPMRRKVVNITSGSGKYPVAGMAAYSSAKSGLNMLTECIGLEQKQSNNPVEVIAIDPGMVETSMQQIARSKSEDEFEMTSFFKRASEEKLLNTTDEIASHVLRLLEERVANGTIVKYDK